MEVKATRSLVMLRLQAPPAVMVTGSPELAVAVGVKLPPMVASTGVGEVTVIVCAARSDRDVLHAGFPRRRR